MSPFRRILLRETSQIQRSVLRVFFKMSIYAASVRLGLIRLDRLGRSLRDLLETVDMLKAQKFNLISLEEDIDTTSAAGELVFHVFGAIEHFERRLISARTKDGVLAARKRGRTPGRPPLHADTVSALQELVDNGTSVTRAAKYVGIGRSTAYRVIRETRPSPQCSHSPYSCRSSMMIAGCYT